MPLPSYNFRRIFKNFFSLNLVQLSNAIFPLIIIPYVVRILGVEKFGLVSFVQAFIMYFVTFSDYGFNLTGTREISVYREDIKKISEIFSSILILKLILGFICLIIFFMLVLNIEQFKVNYFLYIAGTGILFGSILFPHWFFQGIEKMEIIPTINISIRTIQLILIYWLVKAENDYFVYMFIISVTQLAIGIAGLFVSVHYFNIKIILPARKIILSYFKNGFSLFSANIGTNLFANSTAFVLGILAGDYAVGIFSAADKIRQAVLSIIISFTLSAYPNALNLMKDIKSTFVNFFKKALLISSLIGFGLSLFLFVFAKGIVFIMLGNEFQESVILIQWFSITPLIVAVGMIFRILVLVTFGYDALYTRIILFSVFLHFILLFSLIPSFNSLGAVYTVIIIEFLISVLSILAVLKKNLLKSLPALN